MPGAMQCRTADATSRSLPRARAIAAAAAAPAAGCRLRPGLLIAPAALGEFPLLFS
jgi:hypothetical protein